MGKNVFLNLILNSDNESGLACGACGRLAVLAGLAEWLTGWLGQQKCVFMTAEGKR